MSTPPTGFSFSAWGRPRATSTGSQDSTANSLSESQPPRGRLPSTSLAVQPQSPLPGQDAETADTTAAAAAAAAAANPARLSSSFASSGQREPLRSFINPARREHLSPVSSVQYARSVREDTAELASYPLGSGAGGGAGAGDKPGQRRASFSLARGRNRSSSLRTAFSSDAEYNSNHAGGGGGGGGSGSGSGDNDAPFRPGPVSAPEDAIEETSEPEPSPPRDATSRVPNGTTITAAPIAIGTDGADGADSAAADEEGPSLLTQALRRSPPNSLGAAVDIEDRTDGHGDGEGENAAGAGSRGANAQWPSRLRLGQQQQQQQQEPRRPLPNGQASEATPLLGGSATTPSSYSTAPVDGATDRTWGLYDLESQKDIIRRRLHRFLGWLPSRHVVSARDRLGKAATQLQHLDKKTVWESCVVAPVACMPAVVVGLLLNILDALSYGMILFPLGSPVFANLGSAGISMFYVSTIVSQLIFSSGSIFKGGVGSELIEVVPFFHSMAATITTIVGEDDAEAVIATTIASFALSAMVTGSVFYLMGHFQFGYIVGFIPRHILIGCIGGVGWFLVQTGFEVTARIDGSLNYDLATLQKLVRSDTLPLWIIPIALATVLFMGQKRITSKYFLPLYIIAIPFVFYFATFVSGSLDPPALRGAGWVFDGPPADEPWWFFYTLYRFDKIQWSAIAQCVPAMFALTFFGILHVPINVPALALQIGEDHADLNHELKLHGYSNLASGCLGSIQNYLVYANTLFFMRSGGNSRLAGMLLAVCTFCVMLIGPQTIGFIPVMMVGCLIFDLGFELLVEAVWLPRKKLKWPEFVTVVVIVLIMGIYDFVVGIGVGILLAFVALIFQTSQISAVRATYSGDLINSTVRRNHSQQHYLRQVGRQICIVKVAGYLFFGTIVSVERKIRELIADVAFLQRPIRYLILDLRLVTGLDYSAGEAFNTISRLLKSKSIHLVLSGVDAEGALGHDLRAVGLGEDGVEVAFLPDINTALEFCENELLKTLYLSQEAETEAAAAAAAAAAAKKPKGLPSTEDGDDYDDDDDEDVDVDGDIEGETSLAPPSLDVLASSPRQSHLQAAAQASLLTCGHGSNSSDNPDNNTNNSKSSTDARRLAQRQRQSRWQNFSEPLRLMLQIFSETSDQNEDFWFRATPYFVRREFRAGQLLFRARAPADDGFYLLETGIVRAEYDLAHGQGYHETIVAGTTCGELPFFSETPRTATTYAELDCVAWVLDRAAWRRLQKDDPEVAAELLHVALKLTAERMETVPSSTMLMAD